MNADQEVVRILGDAQHLNPDYADGVYDLGSFERCSNKRIAAAVNEIFLHGLADEAVGDTDSGLHAVRVGHFVLFTNSQGFHTLEEFDTPEKAMGALLNLEYELREGLI